MSDLQYGLLVIGAVVVAGVGAFNWWQERQLRKRLEQAFGGDRGDVLDDQRDRSTPTREDDTRREPQLRAAVEKVSTDTTHDPEEAECPVDDSGESATSTSVTEPATDRLPDVPWMDPRVDFIVSISGGQAITADTVQEILATHACSVKPCRSAGYDDAAGEWIDLSRVASGRYSTVRISIQLVNRAGVLTVAQLGAFLDAVRLLAGRYGSGVVSPEPDDAIAQARTLDQFCADVDVAIGVNVIAQAGMVFAGHAIRDRAHAAGLTLQPAGIFACLDENGNTLFSLDNHEPAPFLPEQMNRLSTTGITLLLDVPRVADGAAALERMLQVGAQLGQSLGGRLVDDNRVPLNDAGMAAIRKQLAGIAAAMEHNGVSPGSERAMRLFA